MVSVPRLPGRRSDRRPGVSVPAPDPAAGHPPRPAGEPGEGGPGEGGPGGGARASLGELVARIAGESGDLHERRRQLAALTRALGTAARGAGAGVRNLGQLLADTLADAAPRIPVRDAATLRIHHPGRSDDQIADALIRNAARTTAAFGAAVGAMAAVEFVAPPTYLAAPVQIAAETVAVAAVEVKLVAELHELYGELAGGTGTQRGAVYLTSWVGQRALDPRAGLAGLSAVLGYAAKRELRTMLMRRMGRNLTTLAPFLAGALAGGAINRRATRALGEKVAAELRGRRPTIIPG